MFISFAKVGHLLYVRLALAQKLNGNLSFKFNSSAQLLQNCWWLLSFHSLCSFSNRSVSLSSKYKMKVKNLLMLTPFFFFSAKNGKFVKASFSMFVEEISLLNFFNEHLQFGRNKPTRVHLFVCRQGHNLTNTTHKFRQAKHIELVRL
jgi:hypothetical protein